MSQIQCQFKDYQEQKITAVCMDIDCKSMRLCCYQCKVNFTKTISTELLRLTKSAILYNKTVQNKFNFLRIEYWNKYIQGMLKNVVVENGLLVAKKQNEEQLSEESVGSEQKLQFSKTPIELEGHQSEIKQVTISQDGSLIASGSWDKTVRLWDGKIKTVLQTIENSNKVYRVAIFSKNEYLAFSDSDQSITLFDLKFKRLLWKQYLYYRNDINCIIFSQDAQNLLSGGDSKEVNIWSVITSTEIHCFQTNSFIEQIVMSRDNKLVSCICDSGAIYIWNFQTQTKLFQEKNKYSLHGYGLCTSADQQIFISSGSDGRIKIWKQNKSKNNLKLIRSIQAASNLIFKVLLTSNDLYIISICNPKAQIMIHERQTGKLIQVLESGLQFEDYAFISISNDMNTLVSSNGKDKTFRIWTKQ